MSLTKFSSQRLNPGFLLPSPSPPLCMNCQSTGKDRLICLQAWWLWGCSKEWLRCPREGCWCHFWHESDIEGYGRGRPAWESTQSWFRNYCHNLYCCCQSSPSAQFLRSSFKMFFNSKITSWHFSKRINLLANLKINLYNNQSYFSYKLFVINLFIC